MTPIEQEITRLIVAKVVQGDKGTVSSWAEFLSGQYEVEDVKFAVDESIKSGRDYIHLGNLIKYAGSHKARRTEQQDIFEAHQRRHDPDTRTAPREVVDAVCAGGGNGGFRSEKERTEWLDNFLLKVREEALKFQVGSPMRKAWIECGETTMREYAERAAKRREVGCDATGRVVRS